MQKEEGLVFAPTEARATLKVREEENPPEGRNYATETLRGKKTIVLEGASGSTRGKKSSFSGVKKKSHENLLGARLTLEREKAQKSIN